MSFPEPYRAILEVADVSPEALRPGEALVKGIYSIVSAGTELSSFIDGFAVGHFYRAKHKTH